MACIGGGGKTCAFPINYPLNQADAVIATPGSQGIGGGSILNQPALQKRAYYVYLSSKIYAIAGGGGASPNGAGGTDWQVSSNLINGDEYVNAGTNGTDERGGNGGDIYACNNPSCTSMVAATGGIGGATVTYECGGQTAKSYGGGGGGGAYSGTYYANGLNGGNGGSGSTDHSDTSFVRIYRI